MFLSSIIMVSLVIVGVIIVTVPSQFCGHLFATQQYSRTVQCLRFSRNEGTSSTTNQIRELDSYWPRCHLKDFLYIGFAAISPGSARCVILDAGKIKPRGKGKLFRIEWMSFH